MKAELWIFCTLCINRFGKAKMIGVLLLALFPLAVIPSSLSAAEAKPAEILLLHTNNVTGNLFPCPT